MAGQHLQFIVQVNVLHMQFKYLFMIFEFFFFLKIIENMREELAPFNVRLAFIAPGMTDTPIFDNIG